MHSTKSLIQTDTFTPSFYKRYSRFKHGSKTHARFFGQQVAEALTFAKNKRYVFYSAACNNIPTASDALKDYIMQYCAPQFEEENISVKKGFINRKYSYDEDYGKMSKEERKNSIGNDVFYLDKVFIEPDDILVFVDDIKITGSHEDRIKALLEKEGISNEVLFVYIAEYTGEDPKVEHDLNHFSVNNLLDVNEIVRNEEFTFNTRVVKFILRADPNEFYGFITYQSKSFKETLYALAVVNGYHSNKVYKANFETLKTTLHG